MPVMLLMADGLVLDMHRLHPVHAIKAWMGLPVHVRKD